MKTFDIYQHPILGYQAVKQGFAWPAFFFTVIWALVKKMWKLALVLFGVMFLLSFIEAIFEQGGSEDGVILLLFLQLVFFVFVGAKGNDWRRKNLESRGFKHVRIIQAKTVDAAIGEAAS